MGLDKTLFLLDFIILSGISWPPLSSFLVMYFVSYLYACYILRSLSNDKISKYYLEVVTN